MLQSSPVTNLFLPLPTLPSPPASCGGTPMCKPICYVSASPLQHLHPCLSQKLSKSFPHKDHIPRTLGTSHFKVPQYYSNTSLLCHSLCPFHNCPFPLHSIQVISLQEKALWGLHTQPHQGYPITYFKLRFWISAMLLAFNNTTAKNERSVLQVCSIAQILSIIIITFYRSRSKYLIPYFILVGP